MVNLNRLRHPKIYTATPPEKPQREGFEVPNWAVWLFIGLILILAGLWIIFYSPYFAVKQVMIEGNPSPEIKQNLLALTGKNIFRLGQAGTEQKLLAENPAIAKIRIIRGIPDTLKIKVSERRGALIWASSGKNYLVDEGGIVFKEIAGEQPENLLKITDSKNVPVKLRDKVLTASLVFYAQRLSQEFYPKTGMNLVGLEVGEVIRYLDLQTDKGWKVLIDSEMNLEYIFETLGKFLAQHKEEVTSYVGLRVPGQIYYQ